MKKHFWRILTVLLMACLGMGVLAACGDGEEPENPPAPPAVANPYEGIWTGASATDFIMSGTQTVSAAVDFVEGQAHEGYVVATITGSGADAETYYAAFGIDKDGETYKGDLFFGDDTVEVTLSLANNQLKAVVPSFEEGEDPTTLTFTSRNTTLPAAISPTGTLYCGDDSAETIFTFDFTNKKFYVNEAQQVAKFVNVANYVVIETEQGEGKDAFTACLIVYQKGTAYHCNGMGDDMELSTTKPVPAPRYSVTYAPGDAGNNAKDMPVNVTDTYHEGDEFYLPGGPDWTGHDFEGWLASTDQETYDAGDLYTFTDSNVTFTAQWSTSTPAATYTVQFEQGDHGTLANGDPVSGKEADEAVTLPTVTPTTGYTFDGWYKDATKVADHDDTTYSVNAEHAVSGTITLTAHYTPKQYTVTLNVGTNGTLAGGAEATVTATYDQSVTLPTVTANKGYTFKGWFTEATAGTKFESGSNWTTDTTEPTLYAQYDYIEYTVEYVKGNVDGDPTGMPTDASITVSLADNNNKFTLPTTEPTLTDHVFDGWKLGTRALGKTDTEITITAADLPENDAAHKLTVTATWHEEGKLSVTYELGDHAAANQDAPTQPDVVSGTLIDLPAAPTAEKGYRFIGWYVKDTSGSNTKAGDAEGEYNVTGNENITIIAKYETIKYKVHFDKGEGTVEGTIADVADFTVESEINLAEKTGYTRTGYTLTEWKSGSTTLNANATFKLSEHEELIPAGTEDNTGVITLTAQWTAKTYTVTLEAGDGTLADNTVEATYDAPLDLSEKTPTPAAGYTFKGWFTQATAGEEFTSGSEWTTDGTELKLYAQYDKIKYTVEFALGDHGTGSAPDQQTEKTVGDSIDLTTPVGEEGWVFDGWYTKDDHKVDDEQYAINPSDADDKNTITLTAHWVEEYTVEFYDGEEGEGTLLKSLTYAKNSQIGNDKENTGYADLTATKNGHEITGWYYLNEEEHVTVEAGFTPSDHADAQHKVKIYATWKHNYVNGVCSHCEDVCGHENMQDGTCPDCGVKFTAFSDEKAYINNLGTWGVSTLTDYTITEGEHVILNAAYATNSDEIYQGIIVRVAQAGTEMYFIRPAGDYANMSSGLGWNTSYGSTVMNAPGMTSTDNTEYINLKKTGKTQIEAVFENDTLTVTYRLYNADGSLNPEKPYTMTWTITNMTEDAYTVGFAKDGCTLTAEGAKIGYYKWYWETDHVCDYTGHDHHCKTCGKLDPEVDTKHDYSAYGHLCTLCGKVDPDKDSKHNYEGTTCTLCGAEKVTVSFGGTQTTILAEKQFFENLDTTATWDDPAPLTTIFTAQGDFAAIYRWEREDDEKFRDGWIDVKLTTAAQYFSVTPASAWGDLYTACGSVERTEIGKEYMPQTEDGSVDAENDKITNGKTWLGSYTLTVVRVGGAFMVKYECDTGSGTWSVTYTAQSNMTTADLELIITGNPFFWKNMQAYYGTLKVTD